MSGKKERVFVKRIGRIVNYRVIMAGHCFNPKTGYASRLIPEQMNSDQWREISGKDIPKWVSRVIDGLRT